MTNHYQAPCTNQESSPHNGIDWRMLAIAIASPFACVSILAFAFGLMALILSVGRLMVPAAQPQALPALTAPVEYSLPRTL